MSLRYLCIYPHVRPELNPTLLGIADRLHAQGHRLEVICAEGWTTPHRRSDGTQDWSIRQRVPLLAHHGENRLRRLAKYAVSEALARAARGRFDAVLGADPEGLVQGARVAKAMGCPLVYLSFELMFADELLVGELAHKRAEVAASRHASIIVIQDPLRASLLIAENDLDDSRVAIIPNAPLPSDVPPCDQLRAEFGFGAETRTVLYAGALSPLNSRELFVDMVASWPQEFELVIHAKQERNARLAAWSQQLTKGGRIHFTRQPVAPSDLNALFASCDFGLAPYRTTPDDWGSGKNIRYLGRSSGKIASLAMCGKPILCTRLPLLEDDLASYDCGRSYDHVQQTGSLLAELERSYENCSDGARRYYDEQLDPSAAIDGFCQRLHQLAKQARGEA